MRLMAKVTLTFMLFGLSIPALAQVQDLEPFESYLPVMRLTNPATGVCPASNSSGSFCIVPNSGVHISFFSAQIFDWANSLGRQFGQELHSVNNELKLQQERLFSLTAASAAIQDAIPNSEDRFAVRLNAAGFSKYLAGSAGISAKFTKTMRFSFNYARSQSENVFNGGVNLSIR